MTTEKDAREAYMMFTAKQNSRELISELRRPEIPENEWLWRVYERACTRLADYAKLIADLQDESRALAREALSLDGELRDAMAGNARLREALVHSQGVLAGTPDIFPETLAIIDAALASSKEPT